MSEVKLTVKLVNPKDEILNYTAYEVYDANTYGNGHHIGIRNKNGNTIMYVDCSYELKYEFIKTLKAICRNHWGENLAQLTIEEV